MSEAQHTPGPWTWTEDADADPEENGCAMELHREGFNVGDADSILYHGADWRITEANARLIAAAPQMFDCLTGVLEQLEDWGSGGGPLAQEVRAAIARATGQEAAV